MSDFVEDENEKKFAKNKLLKGSSDADESERESGSSNSINIKQYGLIEFVLFTLQYLLQISEQTIWFSKPFRYV